MRRIGMPLAFSVLLSALAGCSDDELGQVHPEIDFGSETLDFGVLPVLHVSSLERTIGNRGLSPLLLSDVSIGGEDAGYFTVQSVPETVSVGGGDVLELSFRPQDERRYSATLSFRTNDPEKPLIERGLTGEGRTSSAIEIDPPSLHFGLVGEGAVGIETFEVRSVGTAPLIVEFIELEEGTARGYQPFGSWRAPETVDAGGALTLALAFSPEQGQLDSSGAILVRSTDPGSREVRVPLEAQVNRAPIAVCGDGEVIHGAPGGFVTFDGSESYDPDGHEPLSYAWEVLRRPISSLTELAGARTASPTLELDVAGTWEAQLSVEDALGARSLSPCRVTVRAVAAEKLYVELVWDHPVTDLDLHLLAGDGQLFSDLDCWWGNPSAFGCEHSGDDLAGFGPEWARLAEPEHHEYTVMVRFAKANGASQPKTQATVRVYQYGVLSAEMRRGLEREGMEWEVLGIEWPSGEVVPLDTVRVEE